MENLKKLLTFSDVKSEDEVSERMAKIAFEIMYSYNLAYEGMFWEITALEFYLDIPNQDNKFSYHDPFIHMNSNQKRSGTFYVHDDCKRAANYSGIDIACGTDGANAIHGGILIRELNRNDGSAIAVKSIIRKVQLAEYIKTDKWNPKEKEALLQIHTSDIFTGPLKLLSKPQNSTSRKLYRGKRILSISPNDALKRTKLEQIFIEKKLRYSTWKNTKHKRTMEEVAL